MGNELESGELTVKDEMQPNLYRRFRTSMALTVEAALEASLEQPVPRNGSRWKQKPVVYSATLLLTLVAGGGYGAIVGKNTPDHFPRNPYYQIFLGNEERSPYLGIGEGGVRLTKSRIWAFMYGAVQNWSDRYDLVINQRNLLDLNGDREIGIPYLRGLAVAVAVTDAPIHLSKPASTTDTPYDPNNFNRITAFIQAAAQAQGVRVADLSLTTISLKEAEEQARKRLALSPETAVDLEAVNEELAKLWVKSMIREAGAMSGISPDTSLNERAQQIIRENLPFQITKKKP